MRLLFALSLVVLLGTEASAQAFNKCGYRGGSGWRIVKMGKCVGVGELTTRCGDPPSQKCKYECEPPQPSARLRPLK